METTKKRGQGRAVRYVLTGESLRWNITLSREMLELIRVAVAKNPQKFGEDNAAEYIRTAVRKELIKDGVAPRGWQYRERWKPTKKG